MEITPVSEELAPLIAAFGDNPYAGKNAKIYRRMRANLQRRDDEGQFAFQGGMGGFNVRLSDGRVIRAIGRYIGESGNTLANSKAIFHVTNDPNLPDGFYLVNGNNIRSYAVTLDKLPEGYDVPDVTGKAANNAQDIATLERLDAPPGWVVSKDKQGRTVLTTDDGEMRIVFPAQDGGEFELYKGKGATAKSKNKNLGRIFDAADDLDLEDDLSDPDAKAEQKSIKARKNKVLTRLASDNKDERDKAQAEIEGILSEQEALRKATPVAELTQAQAGDVTEGGLDEIEQDNVDKQVQALKKISAADLKGMPVGSKITVNRKGNKGKVQELVKSADGKWREPGNPNYAATDRQLAAAEVLTKADENTAKDILGIYEGPAPRKLDGSLISKADLQAALAKLPTPETKTTKPAEGGEEKDKRSVAHKLWQAIAGLSDKMSPLFARAGGNSKAIAEDKELQELLADWKKLDTDGYRRRELQNMWDTLRDKARGIDDILRENPNSTDPQIKLLRDFRNGPIQDRLNELSKVAGDLGNEVLRRQREGVAPNVSGTPTHDIGPESPDVAAFRGRGVTPTLASKKQEWENKEPWQQWGKLFDMDQEMEKLLPTIFDNPEDAKKFNDLLEEMRQLDVDGARRMEMLREAAELEKKRDAAKESASDEGKKFLDGPVQDRIDELKKAAGQLGLARSNADLDELGPVTDRDPVYDVTPESDEIKNFRENGTLPGATETTETVDGPAKWREFAELYKKLRDALLNKVKEVPAIKKALRALDADYAQQEDLLERRADVQNFLDNPPEDLTGEQRQEAEYLLENIDDALKEIEDSRASKQARGEAPATKKPTTDYSRLLTNQEGEVQIPKRPAAEKSTDTELPKPGAAKPTKTDKPKTVEEQWAEVGDLTESFYAAVRGGDDEAAKAIWKEISSKYPVLADWIRWAATSEDPSLTPEERKKILTTLAILYVAMQDAREDGVEIQELSGLTRGFFNPGDNASAALKRTLKKGFPEIAEFSSELSLFMEVALNVHRISDSVLDKAKPGQTIWYRDPAKPEAGHKLLTKNENGEWVDADGNVVEIASKRKDSDVIDGIVDQEYIDGGIADAIDDFASVTDLGNSGGLRSAVTKVPKAKAKEKATTSDSKKDADGLELNADFIAKNVQVTTDENGNITATYDPGPDVSGIRLKISYDKATNKILVEFFNRHGHNIGKYGPYDVQEGKTPEEEVQKWIKFFSDKLAKHHANKDFEFAYETLPDEKEKEEEEETTDGEKEGEGDKEQESTEDPEEVKKRWASVDELFNAIKDIFSRLRSGEFWSNNPEVTERMNKLEGEDLDQFLLFDIAEYKDSIDRAMLGIRSVLADMPDGPEKDALQAFHDLMQEKSAALKQWIEATNSARIKRREDGLGPNNSGKPSVDLPARNSVDDFMATGIPPEGVNIPGYEPPKPGEEKKPADGGGSTNPPGGGGGGGTTPPGDGDQPDGTQPPPRPKRPRWVWERTPDPAVDPTRYMNMYEVRRWMRRRGLQTSYPYTDSRGNRRMRSGYRVVQRENGWVDIYYDVDDERLSPEEARAFAAQKVAELTAMLKKDGRWEFRGPRWVRREVFDDGTPTHDGPTPPGSANAPDGASGGPEGGSADAGAGTGEGEREQDAPRKPRFRDQTPEEEAADAAEAEAAKERAARDEERKKSAAEDAEKKAATPNQKVKVGDTLPDDFDANKLPAGTVVEVMTLWGDDPITATKGEDGKWYLANGMEVGFDPAVEPVKLVSLPDGATETEGEEKKAEEKKSSSTGTSTGNAKGPRFTDSKDDEETESTRKTNADGTRGQNLITEEVSDADLADLASKGLPTPDDEQKRVIEGILSAVLGNKIARMVVQALAGSGKTATLVAAANILARRNPDKNGLYIVFNKRAAAEGRRRMPETIESRTGDSLAASWVSRAFTNKRLNAGERNYRKIAEHFGLKDIENGPKAAAVARKLLKVIDRYSASADDDINELHFVNEYGVQILPFTPELLAKANMMWEDLQEENSFLSFDHNHAVKMWALTRPDLSKEIPQNDASTVEKADFIFIDEAQDTNPVLAKVYRDQVIPVIFVGDSRQSIYGFRGAVDEMDKVNAEVILPISNTYRMGQELAGWANGILSIIGSKFKMRSKVDRPSEVAYDISNPDLIITFTRNGLIDALLREEEKDNQAREDAINNGQEPPKPRIFGITSRKKKELQATLDHYKWLNGLGPEPTTKEPAFQGFSSWAEVMDAVLQPDADSQLVKLVSLMVGKDSEVEKLKSKYNAAKVEDFLSRVVSSDGGMWSEARKVPFTAKPQTRGTSANGTIDFNIQEGADGQITVAMAAAMSYFRSLGGKTMTDENNKLWVEAKNTLSKYIKDNLQKNFYYFSGPNNGSDILNWEGSGTPTHSWMLTFKNQAELDEFMANFPDFTPEEVEVPGPKPDVVAVTAHEYKGGEANRVQLGDDWGVGRAAPKFFTDPTTGRVTTTFPARETMRLLYVAITRAKEALGLGGASWIEDWITDDDRNPDVPARGLPDGAVWPTEEEQDAENERRSQAREDEEARRKEEEEKKKEEEKESSDEKEEAFDGEEEEEQEDTSTTETEEEETSTTETEEEEEETKPEEGPFPGPTPGSPQPEPETKREKNFWREFFSKILRDGVTDEDVDTIIAFLKEGIDRYARPIIKNMLQRMASLASKGMNSYYAVRNLRRNAANKISEIINGIKYDLTHPVVLLPEVAQEFLQKLNNVWIDLLKSIRKNFFESPDVPFTAQEESENPEGPNPPGDGPDGPDGGDDNNGGGGGGGGTPAGGKNILVAPEDLADDKNPPTIFVRDENTGDIETYDYIDGVGYVNRRTGDILTKDDVVDDSVYGNVSTPGEEDAVIVEDEEVPAEPQKELEAGQVRPALEAGQNEADFNVEGWERVETDDVLDEEINKIALQDVADIIQDFSIDNLNFDSTEENNKANEAAAGTIKKLADAVRMAYRGMRHFRYGNVEVVVDGKYNPEAVKKLLAKAKQLADAHPIQKADGTPTRFWIFETANPDFAGGFTAANGDIIIPMNVANINNPNHIPAENTNLMPAFNELAAKGRWYEYPMVHEWGHALMALAAGGFKYSNAGKKLFEFSKANPGFISVLGPYGKRNINEGGAETFAQWHFQQNGDVAEVEILQGAIDIILGNDVEEASTSVAPVNVEDLKLPSGWTVSTAEKITKAIENISINISMINLKISADEARRDDPDEQIPASTLQVMIDKAIAQRDAYRVQLDTLRKNEENLLSISIDRGGSSKDSVNLIVDKRLSTEQVQEILDNVAALRETYTVKAPSESDPVVVVIVDDVSPIHQVLRGTREEATEENPQPSTSWSLEIVPEGGVSQVVDDIGNMVIYVPGASTQGADLRMINDGKKSSSFDALNEQGKGYLHEIVSAWATKLDDVGKRTRVTVKLINSYLAGKYLPFAQYIGSLEMDNIAVFGQMFADSFFASGTPEWMKLFSPNSQIAFTGSNTDVIKMLSGLNLYDNTSMQNREARALTEKAVDFETALPKYDWKKITPEEYAQVQSRIYNAAVQRERDRALAQLGLSQDEISAGSSAARYTQGVISELDKITKNLLKNSLIYQLGDTVVIFPKGTPQVVIDQNLSVIGFSEFIFPIGGQVVRYLNRAHQEVYAHSFNGPLIEAYKGIHLFDAAFMTEANINFPSTGLDFHPPVAKVTPMSWTVMVHEWVHAKDTTMPGPFSTKKEGRAKTRLLRPQSTKLAKLMAQHPDWRNKYVPSKYGDKNYNEFLAELAIQVSGEDFLGIDVVERPQELTDLVREMYSPEALELALANEAKRKEATTEVSAPTPDDNQNMPDVQDASIWTPAEQKAKEFFKDPVNIGSGDLTKAYAARTLGSGILENGVTVDQLSSFMNLDLRARDLDLTAEQITTPISGDTVDANNTVVLKLNENGVFSMEKTSDFLVRNNADLGSDMASVPVEFVGEVIGESKKNSVEMTALAGTPEATELLATAASSFILEDWADVSSGSGEAIRHPLQAAAVQMFPETLDNQVALDFTAGNLRTQEVDPVVEAAAQVMYDNTQQFFKDQGISEITVYRGVGGLPGEIYDALLDGNQALANQLLTSFPLSSWSTDQRTAWDFAQSSSDSGVLRRTIPVSQVFTTPLNGIGTLGERELILLGGAHEADVQETDAFDENAWPDSAVPAPSPTDEQNIESVQDGVSPEGNATHYVSRDGSYGDARGIALVDASKFTDEDWETLELRDPKNRPEMARLLADMLGGTGAPTHYVATDGNYGDARGLALVDATNFTEDDWETLEMGDPESGPDTALLLEKMHGISAPSPDDQQNAPELQNAEPTGTDISVPAEPDTSYQRGHTAPRRSDDYGPSIDNITEIYPADILDRATQERHYGSGNPADKESFDIINSVQGNPDAEVTIYRAVPNRGGPKQINPGDWVTGSRLYAEQHLEGVSNTDAFRAEGGTILSKVVKASELFTDANSVNEWGYDPEIPAPSSTDQQNAPDLQDAGVPPEPGTQPIPEGMVRLFHYTYPESLESIRANGLVPNEEGKSFKAGEPALIWANQNEPVGGSDQFDNKPVVEFYVSKEKWESGDGGEPKNALGRPVPAENIIAIHEPWHRWARELVDRYTPEEIAGGVLDQFKDKDPNVDIAISKLEKLYKPEDTSSESGAVTSFQDALDRIYAEASFQVMSDESPNPRSDRAFVKATVADNIRDIMQQKGITWTQARELFLGMVETDLMSLSNGGLDMPEEWIETARVVRESLETVDLDAADLVDLDVVVMDGGTPVTYSAEEYLAKIRSELGVEVENSVEGLQQGLEEAADAFNEGVSDSGSYDSGIIPDYRAGIIGTPEADEVLYSAMTSGILAAWSYTSIDGTVSPAIQKIVAEKFNIANPIEDSNEGSSYKEGYNAFLEKYREALTAAVEAMYEQTQAFLKKQGITSIRAYRGMQINVEDNGTAPLLDEALKTPNDFTFTPYPLSSWSFNKNTAEMFARSDLSEYRRGMLIYADIPALDIFSIPYFGIGALDEYELVITGDPRSVVAEEIFPR